MNSTPIEFHKIWIDQSAATEGIRERFGLDDALSYLIGEKLFSFLHAAERDALFAAEVPAFIDEIRRCLQPRRSTTISITWNEQDILPLKTLILNQTQTKTLKRRKTGWKTP
jgi:hypothetical protein